MPLNGYVSLCGEHDAEIVSRDKGNPQYHKGKNVKRAFVTHYKIDGIVIKEGERCDFLLMNEETLTAYLIELKGSDLVKAAKQLDSTEKALQNELSPYNKQYRIIANKCRTQEIESSAYRKYKIRWNGRLVQKTGSYTEEV